MRRSIKKISKKTLVLFIVISILILLFPFLPYKVLCFKNIFYFLNSNYVKVETRYSSWDGFLLLNDSKELELDKGAEVTDRLTDFKDVDDKLGIITYGLPGDIITFYGTIIQNSDGEKILKVEKWSANTLIVFTNVWDEKLKNIYFIIILFLVLVACYIKKNFYK